MRRVGSGFGLKLSLGRAWVVASALAKGEQGLVLLFGWDHVAIRDR